MNQTVPKIRVSGQSDNGVIEAAHAVLDALERKNGEKLASVVHPDKGLRFSPNAHVDVEIDQIFYRAKLERFWNDVKRYMWGYADGSGDQIMMTPSEYSEHYILPRNFRQAVSISVNDDHAYGNTANNAATVYPDSTRVEYYLQGSPQGSDAHFDWAALRLIFERVDGAWFLIGVIHDQWSV